MDNFASNTSRFATVLSNNNAVSYLRSEESVVSYIKSNTNYENDLVSIILAFTGLTNEEKYSMGLPCYVSNGLTTYNTIGNGYYTGNKEEPSYLTVSTDCTAGIVENTTNNYYSIYSSCVGTKAYIYSNNTINLKNYSHAKLNIIYGKNCNKLYTGTTYFGFSNTKGDANTDFVINHNFTFGENSVSGYQNMTYTFNISTLNGSYYYKHYLSHNGPFNVCTATVSITSVILY